MYLDCALLSYLGRFIISLSYLGCFAKLFLVRFAKLFGAFCYFANLFCVLLSYLECALLSYLGRFNILLS